MFDFNAPNVKVNPKPFESIGSSAKESINAGNKLIATMKLSNYKMKTLQGRKLPEELIPEVSQHVAMMRENGWTTENDEQWCKENNI